jgi:GTP-binding protein EngB required for normal cell division
VAFYLAFYLPPALVLIHRQSLSSLVIDHLLRVLHGREKICIMWIYYDYRDEVRQTAKQMICLLLKQAISADQALCKSIIEKLWKLKRSKTNLTLEETCLVLTNTLQLFDQVYICMDALDEFQQQRSLFLHSLQGILQNPELKNSSRIFFTGTTDGGVYGELF